MALEVYVGGTKYQTVKGSLTIDRRIGQRSTARFTLLDRESTTTFVKGQPVEIRDGATVVFGGFVHTPERKRPAPLYGMLHSLLCVDNHYLADKRLCIESYTAGQDAGDLVQDIWQEYLQWEGVTVGSIQAGPTMPDVVLNHVSVSDALSSITDAAGPFIWYIDELKRLYFVDRTTFTAPWALDGATYRALQGSCLLRTGNDLHRNTQYVWGGTALTDPRTQTFTGDGSNRNFVLDFPLGAVPAIEEGGVPAVVGVKGLDEGCDYYWAKGDAVVYAEVAPSLGTLVEIDYRGQYPFIAAAVSGEDILQRGTMEGSTGIVEDIVREAHHETRASARASAQAKINQYCQESERFDYQTYDHGLVPGQMQEITYAPFGFAAHEMLIESVRANQDGELIRYNVTCITGPALGDWTQFFVRLLKRPDQAIRVGGELLVRMLPTPETLDLAEAPALRDFDFSTGIVGYWVTVATATRLGYHVQHELLDFVEDDDVTEFDTEEYYYVPAPSGKQDGRWDFSTWG